MDRACCCTRRCFLIVSMYPFQPDKYHFRRVIGENLVYGVCDRGTLYWHKGHSLCRCLSGGLHPPQEGQREVCGRRDDLYRSGRVHRLRRLRACLPGFGDLRARRPAGEVEGIHRAERQVLWALTGLPKIKQAHRTGAPFLLWPTYVSCSILSISTSGGSPLVMKALASSSASGGSEK